MPLTHGACHITSHGILIRQPGKSSRHVPSIPHNHAPEQLFCKSLRVCEIQRFAMDSVIFLKQDPLTFGSPHDLTLELVAFSVQISEPCVPKSVLKCARKRTSCCRLNNLFQILIPSLCVRTPNVTASSINWILGITLTASTHKYYGRIMFWPFLQWGGPHADHQVALTMHRGFPSHCPRYNEIPYSLAMLRPPPAHNSHHSTRSAIAGFGRPLTGQSDHLALEHDL